MSKKLMQIRIPIAPLIAGCLGGLLIASLLIILVTNFLANATNTTDLLIDNIELTLDDIQSDTEAIFNPVNDILISLGERFENQELSVDNQPELLAYLNAIMDGVHRIAGFGIVTRDSDLYRIARPTSHQVDLIKIPKAQTQLMFDVVAGSEETVWGEVFRADDVNGGTLINARLGIDQDEDEQADLVILIAMRLHEIVGAVNEASARIGRPVYILHDRDYVIAHTGFDVEGAGLSSGNPLLEVKDAKDEVLASIWSDNRGELDFITEFRDRHHKHAQQQHPRGEARHKGRPDVERFGHYIDDEVGEYIFIYRKIAGFSDRPWMIGTYLSDAEGSVELNRLVRSAVISVIIAIITALITFFLARFLARKIVLIANQAKSLTALDVPGIAELPPSRITEFHELNSSFNKMSNALAWFKLYLPQRLVGTLMHSGNPGEISSQESEVTVLFTDIVGFSTLTENMEPADVAHLLNEHFDVLTSTIEEYGGLVDKFIGDSVMAFWGAPNPDKNHARHAVEAALAIREQVAEGDLKIRIGLHTGKVLVGNIGAKTRLNYTAVGETVNIAQRIEQSGRSAAPREKVVIRASHPTVKSAGLSVRQSHNIHLKGFENPISVYAL